MRMKDFQCPGCSHEEEYLIRGNEDPTRLCPKCSAEMVQVLRPQRHYKPWEPYFDIALGHFVTGKDHRRRLMRDIQCDFRDHPSAGSLSARRDWANEQRKEAKRQQG